MENLFNALITIDVMSFLTFAILFFLSSFAKDDDYQLKLTEFMITILKVFVFGIVITLIVLFVKNIVL